jgi:hypothetical protein
MAVEGGWCGQCSQSVTGGVVAVNGNWYCKDCLYQAADSGRLDEATCSNCGDSGSDMYCSSCSSCEESHGQSECNECYNPPEYCEDHAKPYCEEGCGNETTVALCDTHFESKFVCSECNGDNRMDPEMIVCRICFDAKGHVPSVISDDGNATIGDMEVRWS